MLRTYQSRIVKAIGQANAIVKMPTGSGKTIIAAEMIKQRGAKSRVRASLFLVPTQDLVDQQALVIQKWCQGTSVFRFTGGMADPRTDQVTSAVCLVSTPQAFLKLQARKPLEMGWERYELIVFDEVHHVLKDHPYRNIALSLKDWREQNPTSPKVQIVGLSASLTYAVRKEAITKTLNRICRELAIERMESPTVEELEQGGYISQHGRNVEVEHCGDVPEGVMAEDKRKPHLMHSTFFGRIQSNTSTEFSRNVLCVVRHLESIVRDSVSHFESPLAKAKLASWEDYAHKLGLRHPTREIELLEDWYIALRVLVQTWEEEENLALQWLKLKGALDVPTERKIPGLQELQRLVNNGHNFFRLERLRHHLEEKKFLWGDSFRCIVFVQQRLTAVVLADYINSELYGSGIKAGYVAARESKITPSIKMTKSAATQTILDFRSNVINVIVATSVIEEVIQ